MDSGMDLREMELILLGAAMVSGKTIAALGKATSKDIDEVFVSLKEGRGEPLLAWLLKRGVYCEPGPGKCIEAVISTQKEQRRQGEVRKCGYRLAAIQFSRS
jgi:hypothetical protein